MKKIIISAIILIGLVSTLQAQTYHLTFTYDAAGNQTSRNYTTSSSKAINENIVADLIKEENTIEASLENQIKVYPNPTDGELKVAWLPELTDEIKTIRVIELSGRSWEVAVSQINNHSVIIDLTAQASGAYVIQFEFLKHPTITKKIIKN